MAPTFAKVGTTPTLAGWGTRLFSNVRSTMIQSRGFPGFIGLLLSSLLQTEAEARSRQKFINSFSNDGNFQNFFNPSASQMRVTSIRPQATRRRTQVRFEESPNHSGRWS